VDNHFDFGNQVHREADVSGKFTKIADRLHIDLLLLDLEAGLFLNGNRDILCGNRTIEFPRFSGLGSKNQGKTFDLVGKVLELGVLLCAADFSLGTDFFGLLKSSGRRQYRHFLREQEVAPVTIGNLFHVAGPA